MNTISRRLQKLERGFGLVPETEEDRRLLERLEAGRRRVTEWRAMTGECGDSVGQDRVPDRDHSHRKAISARTIIEILQRGRQRARARVEQLPHPADA